MTSDADSNYQHAQEETLKALSETKTKNQRSVLDVLRDPARRGREGRGGGGGGGGGWRRGGGRGRGGDRGGYGGRGGGGGGLLATPPRATNQRQPAERTSGLFAGAAEFVPGK